MNLIQGKAVNPHISTENPKVHLEVITSGDPNVPGRKISVCAVSFLKILPDSLLPVDYLVTDTIDSAPRGSQDLCFA